MNEDTQTTDVHATTATIEVYVYTPPNSNITIDEV